MEIADLNGRIRADIPSVGAMRLEVVFAGRYAVGERK